MIGFEVATLGIKGFYVNDSIQKYELRSVPGRFSGLHMVCLRYAAFKIINPTADIGFDLAEEHYALAIENEARPAKPREIDQRRLTFPTSANSKLRQRA